MDEQLSDDSINGTFPAYKCCTRGPIKDKETGNQTIRKSSLLLLLHVTSCSFTASLSHPSTSTEVRQFGPAFVQLPTPSSPRLRTPYYLFNVPSVVFALQQTITYTTLHIGAGTTVLVSNWYPSPANHQVQPTIHLCTFRRSVTQAARRSAPLARSQRRHRTPVADPSSTTPVSWKSRQ